MTTLNLQIPQDMRSAIASHLLMVTPDTMVKDAIAKMGETGSDYVLVVESPHSESNSLLGILTERDLVRLYTQPIPLDQLPIQAVMSHPVITLKASIFTDINVALNLFQQHQIRHLPVIDDRDRLVGLLAQDTLIKVLTQKALQVESKTERMFDITDLKQDEVKLQQLNKELEKQIEQQTNALKTILETNRATLEAIPDLLLRLQRDGTCLDYIKSGIETEKFLPIVNHISEVLPSELLHKQLQIIDQAIVTGELQVYEHSFLKQDCPIHEEVRIIALNEQEVLAIVRDITARKLSEEELRLSEERLKLSQGIAGDGLWDWDVSTGAVYLSPQWLEMLGFKPDELPANVKTWEQLIHPDDKAWVMERLDAHFQDAAVSYKFDYRLQTKTGEYRWISNYGKAVVRDQQGKPLRMIGTNRDITERKQAEAQLHKIDAHLKIAQRIGNLGNWEFDLQTGKVTWSDKVFHIYGRDPALDTPTYAELQQYVHPEDWEHFNQTVQTAITLAQPYDLEHRICRPDGSLVYVIARGEIICNDFGQIVQIIGTILDVTDLKQAEAALRQLNNDLEHRVERRTASLQRSEARLREAQQIAHLGDWELDLLNQKLIWSPEVFKIFGLDPNQPEPTHEEMLNYYPLEERKRLVDLVNRAIQYGESYETDFQIIRADGASVYIFVRAEPILDAAGQVIGLFGIVMDISDRKLIQEALQRSEERSHATLLALPDWVFRVNRDGQYLDFLTAPPDNSIDTHLMIGKSIYEELPDDILPDHTQIKRSAFQQALDTQTPQSYEQEVLINGKLRYEEVRVAPCGKDEAVFFVRDISDRKQSEKVLLESQQFIQTLVDTVPMPMFWKDRISVYLGCNKQFAKILNMSSATEIIGKTDFDLSWTEDESISYRDDDRWVIESGESKLGIEEMLTKPSGEQVWLETHKAPLRDWTNNVVGVVGMFQDITDRKQAELRLQQQVKQEHLLGAITQRMRSSLNLTEILNATVEEVHQILQSDRVLVYRVFPNGTGAAIAESVSPNQPKILDIIFPEEVFPKENYDRYVQGRIYTLSDREDKKQSVLPCLVNFLAEIRVRAKVVVPIIQNQTLWGLLIAHQCDRPRQWQEWEINLLKQTANQLAIAIQQASLFNQLQQELIDREQAKEEIALQLRRQKALGTIALRIRESLDVNEILATTTQQIKDVMQSDRVIVFQLFPDDKPQIVEEAVSSQFASLKDQNWGSEIWPADLLDCYLVGQPRIVNDVQEDDIWTLRLEDYSIGSQIQSKIVAPILQDVHVSESRSLSPTKKALKIWGFIVIHSCQEKRVWQDSEAQLLQQIANQLAIAIQQASLFKQSQTELVERQLAEAKLTETNAQLAISNQELARATRLKDEFLANMSHELRTPLNAILGMAEGLQEQIFGTVTEQQIKALQTVERSGSHLLELIEDILDVAKIEAGQVVLDCTPTSINHLCQSSLVFIKQQAFQKQIQIDIKLQPNLPDLIADERRIRQVLINLLNNAVKFTPEGGNITLEATKLSSDLALTDSSTPCLLSISVIDTGIGIASDNIPKLFQPFVQVDSALNRQYSGTGLGLVLVKQIVELHGGSVDLTSKLGVGSCFTLKLPYTLGSSTATQMEADEIEADEIAVDNLQVVTLRLDAPSSDAATRQSPLILLAEDNEANISTISSYLQAKGYRILLAKDGQEAIDMAASHQPDLILMDIQMPVMDGLEAIEKIRLNPNLVSIPIIALTALAMNGDRDRCLQAGANDYLTKPVKLKQLTNTIQQLLDCV